MMSVERVRDYMDVAPLFGGPEQARYDFRREATWSQAISDLMYQRYGWSLPVRDGLDTIAEAVGDGGLVMEVGAGSGYVTACLRKRGLRVGAFNYAGSRWKFYRTFSPAMIAKASQIDFSPARHVLMLWPDHKEGGEDMIAETMQRVVLGTTVYTNGLKGAVERECFEEAGELPLLKYHPDGQPAPMARIVIKTRSAEQNQALPA